MLGSEVIKGTKTTAETLVPEKSETIEAGILGKGAFWKYELGGFLTNVKDRIEQVTVGSGPTRYNTFKNISKSEVRGVEGSFGIAFFDIVWSELSYTALDAKNKTDDSKLIGIPNSIGGISISYEPLSAVSLKASVKRIGEQYVDSATKANAYTICSINAAYKPTSNGKLELFAGVDNLFDAKVDKVLGSDPGVYFYGGARYKF
jgi:outer membrane receptor for ferrienterochelin and colicins